jgi:Zn-dependent protease/CBS domain-containing protein
MKNSITFGRVAGVEIGAHYSWLWVAALVSWSLAQGFYPGQYPGWGTPTYWTVGVISALALFASVIGHEMGHALVAMSRGIPVERITLFIFGGVAQIRKEAERPIDEFLVAIAGPVTSFLVAGVFWLVRGALVPATIGAADTAPAGAVAGYLAFTNAALGGFNLLPGFPLDGGRILRAVVWGATGSMRRATQVASYVGQGIGFLLILFGITQALGGAPLNGVWIAVMGWFLSSAAAAARQTQAVQELLQGVPVAALMDRQPAVASPAMPLDEFVMRHVVQQGRRALPVVEGGRLIGLISITDVRAVPQPAWPTTAVGNVMTRAPLEVAAPDTPLEAALRQLVEGSYNQLPVVRDAELVGMLCRADVLRFIQARQTLGIDRLDHSWTTGGAWQRRAA